MRAAGFCPPRRPHGDSARRREEGVCPENQQVRERPPRWDGTGRDGAGRSPPVAEPPARRWQPGSAASPEPAEGRWGLLFFLPLLLLLLLFLLLLLSARSGKKI